VGSPAFVEVEQWVELSAGSRSCMEVALAKPCNEKDESDMKSPQADTGVLLSQAAGIIKVDQIAGDTSPSSIVFGGGVPDPDLYPRELLSRQIDNLLATATFDLGYARGRGQPSLCHAIASRLSMRSGTAVSASDVTVTNGSSGAIELAAAALLDPGDTVITETYTYPAAVNVFRHRGAGVRTVRTDSEGMDPEALESALADVAASGRPAKIVYIVAPFQNPTTARLTADRAASLVEVVDRFGAMLLVDDTYGEIEFVPTELPAVLFDSRRCLHLGSFSKTIAPGLRLGWASGNSQTIEAMQAMRTDLGTSSVLQEAVARLIDSGEYLEHLVRVRRVYLRKRDALMSSLAEAPAGLVEWTVPAGSFFLWLQTAMTVDRLAAAAEHTGVGFVPADMFAVNGHTPHSIRLCYGFLSERQVVEAGRRLVEALVASSDEVKGSTASVS
jgi:2-aminoadipate transaminase